MIKIQINFVWIQRNPQLKTSALRIRAINIVRRCAYSLFKRLIDFSIMNSRSRSAYFNYIRWRVILPVINGLNVGITFNCVDNEMALTLALASIIGCKHNSSFGMEMTALRLKYVKDSCCILFSNYYFSAVDNPHLELFGRTA